MSRQSTSSLRVRVPICLSVYVCSCAVGAIAWYILTYNTTAARNEKKEEGLDRVESFKVSIQAYRRPHSQEIRPLALYV